MRSATGASCAGRAGGRCRTRRESALGAATGATLLLTLPASAFKSIVPVFIVFALVLIIVQPRLDRAAAPPPPAQRPGGAPALAAVFATGVYGGYFGAAQGIMLLAIPGSRSTQELQARNGVKNVLAGLANCSRA